MSLKDNFNQAVREIMKNGLVGDNLSQESKKNSSLNSFLGQQPEAAQPAEAEVSEQAQPEYAEQPYTEQQGGQYGQPYAAADNYASSAAAYPPPQTRTNINTPPIQPRGTRPDTRPYHEAESATVISKNIVVSGGTITGFDNLRIDGGIKCDVHITKDVSVTGKVVGNIECNNAVMSGSAVQGTILSKGQLRMDKDSLLLGNVDAQYLDVNGRIKGKIDVGGKAEFKSDAVVVGDVTASTITVLDGAVIKGFINTTFLQENSDSVFPESITVSDTDTDE